MSDYYTESQMQRIEQAAYDGAILEAGKEWEHQRDESNLREHELESRIAELEAAQRWIPVSERLPEDGDFVLAWDDEIIEVLEFISTFGGACFINIADTTVYPTHWMPLPQPPEVQE